MEFLINVIIDNQETQSENILLNYNKKRIKQVKRRNLLLKSDLKNSWDLNVNKAYYYYIIILIIKVIHM